MPPGQRLGVWTWPRLVRLPVLVLVGLAAIDAALAPAERSGDAELWTGRARNAAGPAIADTTRRALLEAPAELRARAIALVGSSVTFGPNLDGSETISAQLADRLAERADPTPVANLAQPGGSPQTSIPVAAALGTRPIAVLLVELLVPSYAAREQAPAPALATDELALLEAATAAQKQTLARAGIEVRLPDRLEGALVSSVRSIWRLYRLRGALWWDEWQTPSYVVWSLRREVASAGWLPRRFHGQTTNVGRLPWRRAYTGGQVPAANQRFRVPEAKVSERDYAALQLTAELARMAGVPVVFYEIPLNLPFQREFALMSESELWNLERVRELLLTRMAADGMRVVTAPEVPEDAFLDKAHLTPRGSGIVAHRLSEALGSLAYDRS